LDLDHPHDRPQVLWCLGLTIRRIAGVLGVGFSRIA
jgi:hypothetical protein